MDERTERLETNVREGFKEMQFRLKALDRDRLEIASMVAREGSECRYTDAHFALNRFLAYTESLSDVSLASLPESSDLPPDAYSNDFDTSLETSGTSEDTASSFGPSQDNDSMGLDNPSTHSSSQRETGAKHFEDRHRQVCEEDVSFPVQFISSEREAAEFARIAQAPNEFAIRKPAMPIIAESSGQGIDMSGEAKTLCSLTSTEPFKPRQNPPLLSVHEKKEVIRRVYIRLLQCAYDFFARHRLPIPVTVGRKLVRCPQDREWTEWVYMLKRLAEKRRIPAHAYCGITGSFVFCLEGTMDISLIPQMLSVECSQENPFDESFFTRCMTQSIQAAGVLMDRVAEDYFYDIIFAVRKNIANSTIGELEQQ
jgi:hypothetical protein